MEGINKLVQKTSRIISRKGMTHDHGKNGNSLGYIHVFNTFSGRHIVPPLVLVKQTLRKSSIREPLRRLMELFPLIRKVYHESLMESRQSTGQP